MASLHADEARLVRRAAVTVIVVCAVLCAIGVRGQRHGLSMVREATRAIRTAVGARSDLAAGWERVSPEEEARLQEILHTYLEAVPAGDARLVCAEAIAGMARVANVRDFSLLDRTIEVVATEGGSVAPDGEALPAPLAWSHDDTPAGAAPPRLLDVRPEDAVPVEFQIAFKASYAGLVRFMTELQNAPRLMEVRAMSVQRAAPGLEVMLTIRAYGRRA